MKIEFQKPPHPVTLTAASADELFAGGWLWIHYRANGIRRRDTQLWASIMSINKSDDGSTVILVRAKYWVKTEPAPALPNPTLVYGGDQEVYVPAMCHFSKLSDQDFAFYTWKEGSFWLFARGQSDSERPPLAPTVTVDTLLKHGGWANLLVKPTNLQSREFPCDALQVVQAKCGGRSHSVTEMSFCDLAEQVVSVGVTARRHTNSGSEAISIVAKVRLRGSGGKKTSTVITVHVKGQNFWQCVTDAIHHAVSTKVVVKLLLSK